MIFPEKMAAPDLNVPGERQGHGEVHVLFGALGAIWNGWLLESARIHQV